MSARVMTPEETVDAVAKLAERRDLTRSPFHLATCGGCGAPSFQQPCPLCAYYPIGDDRGTWHPTNVTRDQFLTVIDRSGDHRAGGNVATWYVRTLEKAFRHASATVSQGSTEGLRPMLREAQAMTGLATAGDIFDAVVTHGAVLTRSGDGFEDHWRMLGGCRKVRCRIVQDVKEPTHASSPSHEDRDVLLAMTRRLVRSLHDDDRPAADVHVRSIGKHLRALVGMGRLAKDGVTASTLTDVEKALAEVEPPTP